MVFQGKKGHHQKQPSPGLSIADDGLQDRWGSRGHQPCLHDDETPPQMWITGEAV
jgi:hypothetical protein